MGALVNLFYPWGLILQLVAIIHFFRRRPDGFWIWVILFIPFGAVAYLAFEVIPDVGLLRQAYEVFPRRKRIRRLEALVTENPAAGNLEELGDLYLDDRDFKRAREYYDRAIASRSRS